MYFFKLADCIRPFGALGCVLGYLSLKGGRK